MFKDLARSLADLPSALAELQAAVQHRRTPAVTAPVVPFAATGPGWTLVQGEAIEWLRTQPESSVDAVVTDPPYSSGGMFRADRAQKPSLKYQNSTAQVSYAEFAGDSRDGRTWGIWCERWMAEALRVAREGAPICVFTDWRQLAATIDALGVAGWIYRGVVPWDKTEGTRPQPGRFRAQAEFVVWGSKGQMPVDRRVLSERGTSALPGAVPAEPAEDLVALARDLLETDETSARTAVERWRASLPGYVREVVRTKEKRHVTAKPARVLEQIVRICEVGGLVLDPFAGSCTTGVAALRLGYRFLGCEFVPEIHAIGVGALAEVAPKAIEPRP